MQQQVLSPIRSVWALRAAGYADRELADAVRSGHLQRVRRGWYATPDAPPAAVRAVRVGGRLTAVSAMASYGVWRPPDDHRLHVCVAPTATRLRDPDSKRIPFRPRSDVVLHWAQAGEDHQPWRVPFVDALRMMHETPRDHLVAVVDSALRAGRLTPGELRSASAGAVHLHGLVDLADARCESGAESVARIRMLAAGLRPELQVRIDPYRVDFLLAGRVVVEIDGRETHEGAPAYESDRRRDADLVARGYIVLRFTYHQVLYAWDTCLAALRAALLR